MRKIAVLILYRSAGKIILYFGAVFLFTACITIPAPIEDYALARAAMEAARAVDSAKYASGYYHRGMESYHRAEILYNHREYQEARDLFKQSRVDFEKAENSAHVQRKKNGEVL